MLDSQSLPLLIEALERLQQGFEQLPPSSTTTFEMSSMQQVLLTVAEKMQDNYPYHHPLYAGQMLKPPHPVARLAYGLAQFINPNNHALDGGRASSELEKQAVAQIAAMFGWQQCLGHLTSGGTMANLEALWVAGSLHPGKVILASKQAHYTHSRICDVLKIPFESVDSDKNLRMDLNSLEQRLKRGDVGTVVVTLGTTGCGSVDSLAQIIDLQHQYGFRIHVDAAYGGYYKLVANLANNAQRAFAAIEKVDSIVIDPHKHGLQPYGCGCVLFADPSVGRFYQHDSPYTYFSSDELHLGEISLECSRAGAAAVALWATMQLLPLKSDGEFAQGLAQSRTAALELFANLQHSEHHLTIVEPELDIVLWAPNAATASAITALSKKHFQQAADNDLHLALITLPSELLKLHWPQLEFDTDTVTCLRSCLMKPEHLQWLPEIWIRIQQLEKA